eukprot:scaffold38389_cov70-Phaeocystis_antarctica.AAC.3
MARAESQCCHGVQRAKGVHRAFISTRGRLSSSESTCAAARASSRAAALPPSATAGGAAAAAGGGAVAAAAAAAAAAAVCTGAASLSLAPLAVAGAPLGWSRASAASLMLLATPSSTP